MEPKLSPLLDTCKAYGYTPPGQCGLASLGEYDSPPPGHVNSLVPMFLRTNAHAYANLSHAAARIADLHHKLEYLASRASSINDTQPGVLSPDMRDLIVEANEDITNASIIQCGMTGAVRLPDPVVMFLTTKKILLDQIVEKKSHNLYWMNWTLF